MPDPKRLSDHGKARLPKSPVTEIDSLVSNFEAMALALKSNFLELEKRSAETERINSALKTKIKELERGTNHKSRCLDGIPHKVPA